MRITNKNAEEGRNIGQEPHLTARLLIESRFDKPIQRDLGFVAICQPVSLPILSMPCPTSIERLGDFPWVQKQDAQRPAAPDEPHQLVPVLLEQLVQNAADQDWAGFVRAEKGRRRKPMLAVLSVFDVNESSSS